MPVLKTNQAQRISDAVVLDLGDLRRQAGEIVADAQRRAAVIIDNARAEAQTIVRTASDRGYAAGEARGLAEGRAEGAANAHRETVESLTAQLQEIIGTWTTAAARWETDRESMLLDARDDVLRFAFALARRITQRTIDADPSVVVDQVRSALALVLDRSSARVAVHPDDEPLINDVLADLVADLDAAQHITIDTDDTMARGGCLIRARSGDVDARIDTQLDQIAAALFDVNQPLAEDEAE